MTSSARRRGPPNYYPTFDPHGSNRTPLHRSLNFLNLIFAIPTRPSGRRHSSENFLPSKIALFHISGCNTKHSPDPPESMGHKGLLRLPYENEQATLPFARAGAAPPVSAARNSGAVSHHTTVRALAGRQARNHRNLQQTSQACVRFHAGRPFILPRFVSCARRMRFRPSTVPANAHAPLPPTLAPLRHLSVFPGLALRSHPAGSKPWPYSAIGLLAL